MQLQSQGAFRVLRRYTYDDAASVQRKQAKGERPIVWQDGQLVEAVELYDEATGSILRNVTLDQSINGECVTGAQGVVVLDHSTQTVGRPGSDRTFDKHKFRLVAFQPVEAPGASKRD